MTNVIPLNNVTTIDIPFERVLDTAKTELDRGVVIGWDKDGEFYAASSIADGGDVLWLLEMTK